MARWSWVVSGVRVDVIHVADTSNAFSLENISKSLLVAPPTRFIIESRLKRGHSIYFQGFFSSLVVYWIELCCHAFPGMSY